MVKPFRSSQLYVLGTAFLSLFALVGFAYYGLSFFFDFMAGEYGWSRAEVTSGNALGKLLVGPLFGFIAGWMIDRFGPGKLMATGAVLMGTALIGLSFANTLGLFYLFYILNALGYVFGGPLPCQVLISRKFDKSRGKAMGMAYMGIGVGGAIAPMLSAGLEARFGWHTALCALGFLVIVVAMPLPLFLKERPAAKPGPKMHNEPMEPLGNIFRNKNFYLLAIGSMCSMGAVGGIGQHLKLYLHDLDFSQPQAAHVMSTMLLASLAGRLLMGWLADCINRKYVMLIIYLTIAMVISLLLIPDFPGRMFLFAAIFGIGMGGDYMIIPLIAGDLFGVRVLGRVMGIVLVADGVAESLFPVLVGILYNEQTKSYSAGFTLLVAVALTGALIVSLLPGSPRRKKKDKTVQIADLGQKI
ncbi:MAG: MFS transporter [Lentimicrobium sp.]|nr:MFS transporter [Lentimicrobium sp.]